MIIQLIYWQDICKQLGSENSTAHKHREHSAEEQQAFKRSLARRRGRHYVRYC
ncbi:MAG: hypothetical protein WBO73_11045 [Gammaproteobacteria bacterium]|jgi:hypothetical protein